MKFKMKIIARNIVNPEDINDFIKEVSEDQDDRIKSWCNTILKNYLKTEYPNLKNVTKIKKNNPEWLKLAVQNKDAQEIIITDEFKRNLLEHIFPYFRTLTGNIKHSFSEAQKKTKEWDDRKSKFNIKLTRGVKEILKCDNGYVWFEITDEETLYNEGEVLQNCLRKNQSGRTYWGSIENKNIKILTLRDSKGVGHVGAEYILGKNRIEQMYGKQNKFPIKIYHSFCIELLKYLRCDSDIEIKLLLNIVIDNNVLYDIYNLPDTLKIEKDLNLWNAKIIKLPDSLEVGGNLNLKDSDIIKLPDNLRIGGTLYLNNKITKLPDNLRIGGNLNLWNTNITELPNNLEVQGNLSLRETEITEITNDLIVGGNLDLSETRISKLPDNLKIGKSLCLSYTKITRLPDNLYIGGDLDLMYTEIDKLPIKLKVGGNLYVNDTEITKLPDTLKVQLFIYIKEGTITYIPSSLKKKIKFYKWVKS